MKLLLENWRKFLKEDNECKIVAAYHGSKERFRKFEQGKMPSYFTTDRAQVLKFKPETYIYKVKLTLCGEGARYPQERAEGINYVWDYGADDDDDGDMPIVYKMFDAKYIEIIEIPQDPEKTEFDWY